MYEQFAAEFLYHSALAVVLHEGVVLLGSALGEGLKPVGVVGDAMLDCPLFHSLCHCVGNGAVESGTVVDDIDEFLIHVGRQILIHLLARENVFAEVFRRAFFWGGDFYGLFLEGLFHHLKS